MSAPVFTREGIRELDRRAIEAYAIPSVVLMENAGGNATRAVWERYHPQRALILAGTGNNGGDGFVTARHLHNRGCSVRILIAGDPTRTSPDARTNLAICERMSLPIDTITADTPLHTVFDEPSDVLIDALFGTGLDRPIGGWRARLIDTVNERRAGGAFRTVSLDLPSGMDADSGRPLGTCIRADCTCTFVGPKLGFLAPEANDFLGEVVVCDIGAPRELAEQLRFKGPLDASGTARDDA